MILVLVRLSYEIIYIWMLSIL